MQFLGFGGIRAAAVTPTNGPPAIGQALKQQPIPLDFSTICSPKFIDKYNNYYQ